MTIRITGMNSGLDTDAIISELVSAYRAKGDKYVKSQTKLSWTQSVWKSLNTKIFNFYKSLDNFRFGGLTSKKVTVSDSSKASVTASSSAMNGNQTLEVLRTAQAGYMTGGKLNELSSNPSLGEVGYYGGTGKITLKGKDGEAEIEVKSSTKVEDLVKQINESGTGIEAKFEDGAITLVSEGSAFEITGDSDGRQALSKLGISDGFKIEGSYEKSAYLLGNTLSVTGKETTTLSELGYNGTGKIKIQMKKDGSNNGQAIELNVDSTTTIKDLQDQLQGTGVELKLYEHTNRLSFVASETGSATDFDVTADDDVLDKLGLSASAGAIKGAGTDGATGKVIGDKLKAGGVLSKDTKLTTDSTLSQLGYNAGDGWITIKGSKGTARIKVTADTTIKDFISQVNESGAGVRASFDAENQRFNIVSEKTGEEGDFQLLGDGVNGDMALNMMKLTDASGGVKMDGQDALIKLNGAEYTSSTNTFKANGLTIQAQGVTNGKITITTDTDAQGMYDKIKGLFADYNALINEMSSLYNADSSKGYEPLTSDEKEAMSESEISEWEKKIKDSLLRRDNTLSGIMSAMSSAMSITVNVNGKKYSLANLGIKTQSYFTSSKNEKYAYHIDGDSEDDTSSANPDKLMDLLASDPDVVEDVMKQITSKLYSNLDAKMKATSLRSAYTVYNDKEMAKNYSDYTTTIKKWNEKVADIEDSYYKKFSAMEVALSKLQSQMSSFTSMLG